MGRWVGNNPPWSHLAPCQPPLQIHWYALFTLLHTPPLRQGLLEHGLLSVQIKFKATDWPKIFYSDLNNCYIANFYPYTRDFISVKMSNIHGLKMDDVWYSRQVMRAHTRNKIIGGYLIKMDSYCQKMSYKVLISIILRWPPNAQLSR